MEHLQFLNTQMASTKKSKKEEEKKKTNESEAKSPKTPIKKIPSKSPKKKKHENSNSKKSPNGKVKESPQVSIISSSSSGSIEEVVTKKSKPNNKSSNCKSPKTEKSKKRKLKEEDDDNEEGEDGTMCIFGMSRIRRIMKTGDTGSKLPQDVVFLVNKATEMFIEQFCEEAFKYSAREQKESIAYKQLSSVVSQQRRFDFLSDFVPKQLRAKEALARIKPSETAQR